MLIDDVKIKIRAGWGGRGRVAFNKNLMAKGPVGGSGGEGGDVFIEGVSDLSALRRYRFKKEFSAENGEDGKGQFRDGRGGKDLILTVPVGTVVHKLNTGQDIEIVKIGQKVLIARGGRGGRGNFHFRSSINTTPMEFEERETGEEFDLRLELKLIADVGFVGLPNVGKSSLLNELTRAKAKVANYKFTTLEPNLGAYYDLVLADIPGLIEGASKGKGLGIKFLRHIERTKIIFHFLAADSPDPSADYKTVRDELGKYNKQLLEKPEYLFLSKSDVVAPDVQKEIIEKLKEFNENILAVSIYDFDSLESIKKILNGLIREKSSFAEATKDKQKKVIVGGTFDLLHAGHKALLRKAFELGEVNIGLVSDEMAKGTKARIVGNFESRKRELENFIGKEIGNRAEIFEIDDKFGSALVEDFDYIVVSPETYENSLEINRQRQKMNKKPMEIIKIDYVLAEDKKPISSTRIYDGEINQEGKLLK